ncbi:MAG TPA: hypothetical protein VKV16_10855, partial [Solirubrobacteraceae bacterium]|nr:hypothetical protein [Solirubrobacteraceae bacterium]
MVAQAASVERGVMVGRALTELETLLGELSDLERARALARWDQATKMPPGGASTRAQQLATLERLAHERFTSERTGALIAAAEQELAAGDGDPVRARVVAEARRLYERDRRVPLELAVERARAASEGYRTWVAARRDGNLAEYLPVVERNFALAREYASCLRGAGFACAYDALLDAFAPGLRVQRAEALLYELRDELTPIVAQLGAHTIDRSVLERRYPVEAQRRLVRTVLAWMGFDERSWRLDDTVHPFETSLSPHDVRITTRYDEHHFPTALYGA